MVGRRARLLWMALQTACVGVWIWAALTDPRPPYPMPIYVPLMAAMGFFIGLTLTVAWVLLFELFRYRLPALARRGVQQIQRRHTLSR